MATAQYLDLARRIEALYSYSVPTAIIEAAPARAMARMPAPEDAGDGEEGADGDTGVVEPPPESPVVPEPTPAPPEEPPPEEPEPTP